MIRHWIEAMRLMTLPVSIAGVIAGTGCANMTGSFKVVPALLCLALAYSAGPYPLSHHGLELFP